MNFYEFDVPVELDGEQLKIELKCNEVYIRDSKLVIGGELTQAEAAAGLAAHKPKPRAELTIADKLATVGLSVTDLKKALGL
jgi:hypothetical protein